MKAMLIGSEKCGPCVPWTSKSYWEKYFHFWKPVPLPNISRCGWHDQKLLQTPQHQFCTQLML